MRADVAVRMRTALRAISGLAEAAAELAPDDRARLWAEVAGHMRSEVKRVGEVEG